MTNRIGNLVAWTGLGVLALCMTANASVITETESFSLTFEERTFHVENNGTLPIVNDNNGPTSISQLLTFDKFDTGLGTLLGVTISFTSDYGLQATVTATRGVNDDPQFVDVAFFAEGTLGLLLTGPGFTAQTDPFVAAECSATPQNACSHDTGSNNGSHNNASIPGSPLDAFFGPGIFDLTATLSAELKPKIVPDNATGDFADNSTMDGTLNGSWNGSVSVAYTYDSPSNGVPEPLTLYLLVAGLGGLALLRRRRT